MVEIYGSWFDDFSNDKNTLEMIRKSGYDGLEVTDHLTMKKLQEEGIKVSLHNPLRDRDLSLTTNGFFKALREDPRYVDSCKRSDAKTVGFHLTRSGTKVNDLDSAIDSAKTNLHALKVATNKDILFEPMPIRKNQTREGYENNILLTEDKNLEYLALNSGILWDMSHMFITFSNITDSPMRKMEDSANILGPYVGQIHLSVPEILKDQYEDKHLPYRSNDITSKMIYDQLGILLERSPNLKTLTFEIRRGEDEKMHAKDLLNQYEIFDKQGLTRFI